MKKNKRYVRICAALLCAVLCLSVNVAPAMAAKVTQADIDALKGNAASLDKKQKEIQSKLNGLKDDKAAAVQKKTLLDDQIANTNAKISNTEAQISDYNALISQAEIELADAQQREEAQYELFCKRVGKWRSGAPSAIGRCCSRPTAFPTCWAVWTLSTRSWTMTGG